MTKVIIIGGVEYPVTICKPSKRGRTNQHIRCKGKPWRDLLERRARQKTAATASNKSMKRRSSDY